VPNTITYEVPEELNREIEIRFTSLLRNSLQTSAQHYGGGSLPVLSTIFFVLSLTVMSYFSTDQGDTSDQS
jgi:hypothetical protein